MSKCTKITLTRKKSSLVIVKSTLMPSLLRNYYFLPEMQMIRIDGCRDSAKKLSKKATSQAHQRECKQKKLIRFDTIQ